MKLLIAALISLFSFVAKADMFTDAGPTWTKIDHPNDDSVQWAVNPPGMMSPTRLDFISFEDNGARKTFYLIRMKCSNGNVEFYSGKPGAALALGDNCDGEPDVTRMIGIALTHVPKPPIIP